MEKQANNRIRLTPVSILHYFRLVYRSALFLVLLVLYILSCSHGGTEFTDLLENRPVIITVICAVFTVEMIMRFFPSRLESPGSQKQFAQNYIKTGNTHIEVPDNNATLVVLLLWIGFNAVFGALYLKGIFDDGIMMLIASAYSVCDMICILFFCPFETWFLKNKCCGSCRIYNWDYAMMFTPLFFVAKPYTWGLLALSAALLLRWEITFYRHPERFSEDTNAYLSCANCTEKLCTHKKQLRTLRRQVAEFTARRKRMLEK
ncbi:MAG: hypothetical protein J6A42_05350 [Firmicutes bacterium]|nr:hypothetical protein [Bacillota bacterium]